MQTAKSLPILTFHALDDEPSVISFSPRVFRLGMAKLHQSGYRTLSLQETVECLLAGARFPDHTFVITFDDGYQSVYDEAFRILQRYGMSATIFLTVGKKDARNPHARLPSMSGRSMLSWSEIREMQRAGFTFGAHTLTHADLTRLPSDRIETEVIESKARIEDALGASVVSFAYPFGRHDRRSREIVREHFVCSCSDKLGLITASSDPFALERVDAYYLRTEGLFNVMLTRLFPWYIRSRAVPRQLRRAIQPYIRRDSNNILGDL